MTHPPHTPQRRLGDRGRLRPVRIWWERWWQLITGVWLIVVSAVLLIVAVQFYSSQAATARAARTACERSMEFGPRLIDFYERAGVLTHHESELYRRAIPRSCPSK